MCDHVLSCPQAVSLQKPRWEMGWAGRVETRSLSCPGHPAPSSGSGPTRGLAPRPVLAAQALSPTPTSLLSCVLPAA